MAECINCPNSSCIQTINLQDGDNKYRITLCSVVCNSNRTQQTWTYYVEEVSGKDISNWALELCKDITKNDVSSTPSGTVENPNKDTPGGGGKEGQCLYIENLKLCFPGTDHIVENQIKWEVVSNFSKGFFTFTLNKCYKCEEVFVAIKTGNLGDGEKCLCSKILGPSCTEGDCNNPPPPTRGILFM